MTASLCYSLHPPYHHDFPPSRHTLLKQLHRSSPSPQHSTPRRCQPSYTPILTPIPMSSTPKASSSGRSPPSSLDPSIPGFVISPDRYVDHFRVSVCAAHASDKSCPFDSYTCFDAHSRHTRRRPVLVAGEEYNYAPTRCRYVTTLHGKRRCPQGEGCRYAHSTEEMIYHPLVYKTQLCPHPLGPAGICQGFGQHCAKAHGAAELRYPAPCHTNADRSLVKVTKAPAMAMATDVSLGILRSHPAFYMLCYKTDRCPQKSCPRTCERYHNLKERRRCPRLSSYSEQPCPFVKAGGATKNWRDPSRCPDGDACRYSHTLLEQMYHPNIYKTSPCNNFSEQDPTRCSWGALCTHAHGASDMQRQNRALHAFDAAPLPPRKDDSSTSSVDESSSSSRRPKFSLPPPLLNGCQIWQPTLSDDQTLRGRKWNETWTPSVEAVPFSTTDRSRSTSPANAGGEDLRTLLAKLEQLEVENRRLATLSTAREAEVHTWRSECRRLVSQPGFCSVCGVVLDPASSTTTCPSCS